MAPIFCVVGEAKARSTKKARIMKRATPALYLLGLLLISCADTQDPTPGDGDASKPKRSCKEHGDCEDNEICFPKEGCAVPWGRTFILKDLTLEGPSKDFEDSCAATGRWYPEQSAGEQIDFKAKEWSQPAWEPTYRARPDSDAAVMMDFSPSKKDGTCPSHEDEGPLCLSGACEPFRIKHYRSSELLELTNASGDVLKFRLVPDEDGD